MKLDIWNAKLTKFRVSDGDTLKDCILDIGHFILKDQVDIRLTCSRGPINAPELKKLEKAAGIKVRDWLKARLSSATTDNLVWVKTRQINYQEVYGRVLAELYIDDTEIGTEMLELGLVKFCSPEGTRVPFTQAELDFIVNSF